MSTRLRVWIFGACALAFAQIMASLCLHQNFTLTAISDIVQTLLLLSGTLALVPNVVANRGRVRGFWALMTVGVGLWSLYQMLWTYFEVLLRQDVPNPFVGDVILFLHIAPMMGALALQPHAEQDERAARLGSLDFALLLVWWLYLYLYSVIPWQYVHNNETIYEHSLNVLYLTEKVAFLGGLALLWWRSSGSWRKIYANFFGAGLTYALSSYVANWAIERNFYYSGSLYDVPLVLSMSWVTIAGRLAYHYSPQQQPASKSGGHGVWVARLSMIAIFSLPLFAAWSMFDLSMPPAIRKFRMVLTLGAMFVMGVMVFLKQHLLDRELLRLLSSSQKSFEDLRRLQTQLVHSEKLASLGQLVGGAAHELNNPLTAMLGYTDLLAGTALNGEQHQLAEKIGQQVRRTQSLVSSLLKFAKQAPIEKTLVDVNALAQTGVKLCQPQMRARNIEMRTDLAADLPPIFGDSNQLLQVCLHITNNALHAMSDRGGVLHVSTRQDGDNVIFEFSDNGPGAENPDRVFDPFYTTRPVGEGAGLGLSACYGIIQEHNGKILCQNRPEGGATFRIELPVARKYAAAHSFSPKPTTEPSRQQVKTSTILTLPPTP
jgi:signal transduction histidine kinase